MAPFTNLLHPGTLVYFLVFLLIGMAFGAILEMSGFGDSRKLAAQFYFKDLTVLKVMFTAIVTAAVLIFLSSSLGLLNYDRLWVNPTYLYPEIVGGLIMGVGFIVGGFCPGTSLVAASTLKLDGILFVLGGLFGVWVFGESVGYFEGFFYSSFYGRLTVFDWLGTSAGVVVLLLTLMALAMFYLGEIAEAHFGEPQQAISWRPRSRIKISAVASLLAVCGLLLALGQPSPQAKWAHLQSQFSKNLEDRSVYVHPGEVVELKKNPSLAVKIIDVRPEADFNLFHIAGAWRLDPADLAKPAALTRAVTAPENTVFFLVSNGEKAATQAWQALKGNGALNLYIIEGGINKWLEVSPPESCVLAEAEAKPAGPGEQLQFAFRYAIGANSRAAHPDSVRTQCWVICPNVSVTGTTTCDAKAHAPTGPAPRVYTKKVKMQRKVAIKGGCG
jgi:rhodanese-related sulfurtransferase